jgi:hypothetical protein
MLDWDAFEEALVKAPVVVPGAAQPWHPMDLAKTSSPTQAAGPCSQLVCRATRCSAMSFFPWHHGSTAVVDAKGDVDGICQCAAPGLHRAIAARCHRNKEADRGAW